MGGIITATYNADKITKNPKVAVRSACQEAWCILTVTRRSRTVSTRILHDRTGSSTIEGVTGQVAQAVQSIWQRNSVVQCGYCQSGQIMTAIGLLTKIQSPTDVDIEHAKARTERSLLLITSDIHWRDHQESVLPWPPRPRHQFEVPHRVVRTRMVWPSCRSASAR